MQYLDKKYNIILNFDERALGDFPILILTCDIWRIFSFYPKKVLQYFEGVSIDIVCSDKVLCEAYGNFSYIRISTRFLEKLWSCIYIDFGLSDKYPLFNNICDTNKIISVGWSPAMLSCLRYVTGEECRDNWPRSVPKPITIEDFTLNKKSPIRDLVTEVFLYVISVVLLHEVKHIYNSRHKLFVNDVKNDEIDADDFAINVMMDMERSAVKSKRKKYNFFQKKMLAFSELSGYLVTEAILAECRDSVHPFAMCRLESFIARTSKALNFSNEASYKFKKDKYDIRPVIGHVAYIMFMRIQYLVLPRAGEKFAQYWNVVYQVYDSPFDLFFAVRDAITCFCEERYLNAER